MNITIEINDEDKEFQVKPGEILLDLLRREGYTSVKEGCKAGDCGACMVLVNGRAMTSCTLYAAQVDGKRITTLEGLNDELADSLRQEFLDVGAIQCGFCIPGVLISSYSLLTHNPNPTEGEIKAALDGNLCRCTGYIKQIEAIKNVARDLEGGNNERRREKI
ncbi:(2Fe-2S)-binding protein [Candidatus Bipolaricaulota bacterium]|nr:(2Fe-2S)-binding protein [Candidatus Bipolaricaulota bacterium]